MSSLPASRQADAPSFPSPRPASPAGEEGDSAATEDQSETAAVAEAWRRAWLADAPTSAVPAASSGTAATGGSDPLLATSSPEGEARAGRALAPREFHVRVWEENETLIMPQPETGGAREAESQPLPAKVPLEDWSQIADASAPLSFEDMPTQEHPAEIGPSRWRAGSPLAEMSEHLDERPAQGQQALDDLPTMPLKASPGPELVIERASTPRPPRWPEGGPNGERKISFPGPAKSPVGAGGIEELDTIRLAAQLPVAEPGTAARPAQPLTPPPASVVTPSSWSPSPLPEVQEAPLFGAPRVGAGASAGEPARHLASSSARRWEAEETAALPQVEKPGSSAAARSPASGAEASRRRKRPLAVVALVLAVLLISGGLTAWVFVYQPFSVPLITQPQQSFSDQRLGLALSYPRGWSYQLDYQQGKVTFSDSTHTGQMIVLVAPAGDQDLAHYLQKEASQQGLTAAKSEQALAFGGVSWQQVRGTVTMAGASYTEVILATSRAGRLYTFIQLAYQKIYTDEEKQVFAPARASFRFLS
ncbi:hypothetical protein [Thermogemmatispora sp.]|uniref:hypothetical protein n=1 Tax=Thermogemmatispora sp. TaxID=1968838 RepID=UPI0035E45E3C